MLVSQSQLFPSDTLCRENHMYAKDMPIHYLVWWFQYRRDTNPDFTHKKTKNSRKECVIFSL